VATLPPRSSSRARKSENWRAGWPSLKALSGFQRSKPWFSARGSGLSVFRPSDQANGNILDLQGRLITCQHSARNIVRTEPDGRITVLADRYEGKRFNSPNDVAVRSDGTLWFTDPPWGLDGPGELPGHWVFKLDPDTGDVQPPRQGCSPFFETITTVHADKESS
jgi:sugar lactone lactonase YvrE